TKDAIGTSNSAAAMALGRAILQHRLFHFVGFGSTALVLILIAEGPAREALAALNVAILGFTIEYCQYVLFALPAMEWWDVRDDVIACLVTLLLVRSGLFHPLLFERRRHGRQA